MYDNARNIVLVRRAKEGDREALESVLRENAGLIKSVALRFQGRGQDTEDLIQIGTIGMMKAVHGFDEEFGTAFSTYAVHMVSGELKRFLRDDGLIKVSRDIMLMYGREAQSKTRIASPATIPKSGERNRKIHSCMLYLISI